ncbi:nucleoside-diphosphate sugar epimerase [Kribbella antibiotica]|uniref:Nucleoside-diphosphate sugar epimerase n=1 Tax=Kribbella antibiotica TaxID=190195 RepID=A0A4R4YTR6_9ACTN|nr:NAD(P)H-binding protein [Kribbella antibiotica]TDD47669.1 nucleoside-diphosphate sugar epimerase [Kribbella antibiotica]
MTILITGATGNAGGAVLQSLAAAGLPGRALVRSEVALPAGITPVYGDLNDPDSFSLDGVSGIFLLSGYNRVEDLLAKAREAGVERIVLLSSSSLTGADLSNAVAAYHHAAEEAVQASGLAWTFLRPNSFMSNTLRWLDQLQAGDTVRVQFPDVPVSTIHPRDIGDVAVQAFTSDGGSTTYRLTGPVSLTPVEQVAILGEALGRPLTAYPMTRAETHDDLFASMPEPYASAIEGFFGDGTVDETTVTETVPEVTGHPARTLQEWVQENAGRFS